MIQRPLSLRSVLLWTLLGLFLLRVLGQIYVGLYSPDVLPPWPEWYSGLLPYPLLLPAQLLLLMWMTVITYDNTRGAGFFFVESASVKRRLRWIAVIYAGIMVLRYILTMTLKPEMRWLHGTVPIAFHLILAGYIATLTLISNARPSRVGDSARSYRKSPSSNSDID